jgi:AcrR family transcriptional regulator
MSATPKQKNQREHDSGARRRAEHLGPERRRPLVLDAALALFVERGYAGASMDAIAQAAGVTKPVVYECYPSKEELFKALLEREEKRLLEAVTAALPDQVRVEGVQDLLVNAFTALLTAAATAPDSWRVVFGSDQGSEPAVARRFRRGRQAVVGQMEKLVEPVLAEAGVGDSERKAPLYAELLASIGEGGVRALLEPSSDWSPEELGALLANLAARALEAA